LTSAARSAEYPKAPTGKALGEIVQRIGRLPPDPAAVTRVDGFASEVGVSAASTEHRN